MDLHLPVLLINGLLSRVLSCSSNSNFPLRKSTEISHSGNQLKFPSTASSKPVKIKKQKDTKQTDKLLLSKIKCWSSHSWNQNKPFCRIELKQSFFGLCLKTLLCLFKIIPKRFFYIPLCFRQDVLELPLVDTFKLASIFLFFFFIWVFFHNHSQITGLEGKREGISLTPHYHFHPLHRHVDISRVITAESSPLHIGSS